MIDSTTTFKNMRVKILFTDNLISRNRARWSAVEIQKMPSLIIGHRGTLDHAWGSVANRWGVITSAKAVSGNTPNDLSPEEKAVVDKEGYWYAECDIEVAIANVPSRAWLAEMIQSQLLSENSIGFSYKYMRCPNCECAAGDLRSPKCPNSWEDIPYYERVDVQEVFEVSFVEIPDVRRARILEIDGIAVENIIESKSGYERIAIAKYANINFVPPQGARDEAAKALEWRQEFGRGGTAVGIARARDIKNGVKLSPDTLRRMKSFFARHEVDKQAEGFREGEKGYPSNGRIAWGLWGGDAGKSWADKVVDQMDSEDDDD